MLRGQGLGSRSVWQQHLVQRLRLLLSQVPLALQGLFSVSLARWLLEVWFQE